jgi:FixJ family two-component response regulator
MSGGGSTCRDIYILDDDRAVRETVAMILASEGYSTTCFADGLALMKAAREQTPLCMFLDLSLPDFSGMQVLKDLRSSGCTSPIIIISGKGDIAITVETFKNGATDYLEKPFHRRNIVACVKAALQKQHQGQSEKPSILFPD